MTSAGTAREAVERNARAIMAGNLAQVMADLAPDALAQLMQVAAAQGAAGLFAGHAAALPQMLGFEIVHEDDETGAPGERFLVRFTSERGSATLGTSWQPVMGQWKITAVRLVDLDLVDAPAPPPGEEPAGE